MGFAAEANVHGAAVQKTQVSDVVQLMEQMQGSVSGVLMPPTKAAEAVKLVEDNAAHGNSMILEAMQGIDRVTTVASKLEGILQQLEEQAEEISRINVTMTATGKQTAQAEIHFLQK